MRNFLCHVDTIPLILIHAYSNKGLISPRGKTLHYIILLDSHQRSSSDGAKVRETEVLGSWSGAMVVPGCVHLCYRPNWSDRSNLCTSVVHCHSFLISSLSRFGKPGIFSCLNSPCFWLLHHAHPQLKRSGVFQEA